MKIIFAFAIIAATVAISLSNALKMKHTEAELKQALKDIEGENTFNYCTIVRKLWRNKIFSH